MNSEVLRNIGGRGARSVTVVLQGEGRGHFFPKSALRNISMAPYMTFDGNGSYTEVFNIRLSYYLLTKREEI